MKKLIFFIILWASYLNQTCEYDIIFKAFERGTQNALFKSKKIKNNVFCEHLIWLEIVKCDIILKMLWNALKKQFDLWKLNITGGVRIKFIESLILVQD